MSSINSVKFGIVLVIFHVSVFVVRGKCQGAEMFRGNVYGIRIFQLNVSTPDNKNPLSNSMDVDNALCRNVDNNRTTDYIRLGLHQI